VPVIRLDHMVIAVSEWQRPSTSIVRLSAPRSSTAAPTGSAFASRRATQCPRSGFLPEDQRGPLAGPPGNSDICFRWDGPIEEAVAHLRLHDVEVETGPVPRPGAGGRTEHGRLRVVAELIVRAPGHAARARLRQGLGPDSASGGRGSAAKPGPLSGGQGFSLV